MRAALPLLATHAARPLLVARSSVILAATDATAILDAGTTALTGAAIVAVIAITVPLVSWLLYELYVADLRKQRSQGRLTKSRSVDVSSSAYVRPRELWRLSELAEYDGSQSTDGPILLAAGEDRLVYNVARARHLYGPGGEYSVMGGTDASRLLAKNTVKPETEAEAAAPLNMAEVAALRAWSFSFQQKYDVVGRLASVEEGERMDIAEQRREAYLDRIEEMSAAMAVRDSLEEMWTSEPPSRDS